MPYLTRPRRWRTPPAEQRYIRLLAGSVMVTAVLSLGVGASQARPATTSDAVTISMLANFTHQPGWQVLIPNFERVYPNITVNVTYAPTSAALDQLEATEFAAGNAPDLVETSPGCGTPISVCTLAKAGYLAPMIKEPWLKRALPSVISATKYGQSLFAFEPAIAPFAVFTNDTLFKQLGLTVPQTFSQLLDVCRKAQADGTAAVILQGASGANVAGLIVGLAVAAVYGKDKQWAGELRAGTVSFDGTSGWHQALQEFLDMNDAGCFQPGATGTSATAADIEFAQGQGLMIPLPTNSDGPVVAADPHFSYTAHPFPGGTNPNQTSNYLRFGFSLSVNAHSSAQNQAAAQTFVDFIARPKQDALYAQVVGGLTQYEFLEGEIPAFMSSFAAVFKQREYVNEPDQSWWNANVLLALQQSAIGLITGQSSIDGILNAMDAAWKQGPS